jgi:type II secretory pathway predicted ATPase ExeA
MYESFFQLRLRPFTAAPQADRMFPAAAIDAANKTLTRIVERGEGAGLIIGPSGTGKTLLCQALAAEFRQRLSVVLLSSGRLCTRRALLQAILYELRLPYRGMEEGELRLSLIDHLTPERGEHPGLVLFVDEAHTLPFRLLEELRMITNLVRNGQPRVRLVLAGSTALEERFANPKLDSFSQRVAARCYLGSLNRQETTGYVRFQITAAGGEPERVFDPAAYESVFRATDGVPRLVNQVCDHALILAALAECRPLPAAVVEEAWSDLQQLPTPWQTGSQPTEVPGAIVEFAALDDGPDELAPIPFRPATAAVRPSAEKQLDEIEHQLSELEDDFQPAGSIGPEVELVFHRSSDPFGEAFDEEEVVLDRYASLEANLFDSLPHVQSREGGELSSLLAPWTNQEQDPPLGIAKSEQPVAAKSAVRSEFAAPAASVSHKASGIVLHDEPARDRETSRMEPAAANVAEAAGQQDAVIAYAHADDDFDLIVIEEDVVNPPHLPPVAPLVRRQEYRQLFAKLRRG